MHARVWFASEVTPHLLTSGVGKYWRMSENVGYKLATTRYHSAPVGLQYTELAKDLTSYMTKLEGADSMRKLEGDLSCSKSKLYQRSLGETNKIKYKG